jgi:hypothetical protein
MAVKPEDRAQAVTAMKNYLVSSGMGESDAQDLATRLVDQAIAQRGG